MPDKMPGSLGRGFHQLPQIQFEFLKFSAKCCRNSSGLFSASYWQSFFLPSASLELVDMAYVDKMEYAGL